MTIEDVRKVLEQIRSLGGEGRYDPEAAHSLEDDLYEAVLRAIRDGRCADPAGFCALALQSKDIEFPRWCA